jgi:diaminohydroxyphosphoribosylaminopyrimidine deaminase/5-amino-6-(5-phosphoribosylamino)uracil reductase
MSPARDLAWMEMAYGLAEKARGRTSPNPLVGAVVVATSRRRGYHAGQEGPAEILALGMAGRRSRRTLYLTLGLRPLDRTAPCIAPFWPPASGGWSFRPSTRIRSSMAGG